MPSPEVTTAVYDKKGNFQGHDPNEGCEHRTVGDYRAWCHDCLEWCYPATPCVRCERAIAGGAFKSAS